MDLRFLRRNSFPLISAGIGAALLAGTASAAPTDTPASSPLAVVENANSIQVKEIILAVRTGSLQPVLTINVSLSKPGARLEVRRTGLTTPDNITVWDGMTLYSYDTAKKQYLKSASTTSGFGEERLPALAKIPAGTPPKNDTLDGKPAQLYTFTEKTGDQIVTRELWVDPATHLPEQQSTLAGEGDTAEEVRRVVFSDWSVNKPLSPTLFAFTPPTGATELVPTPPAPAPPAQPPPALLADGTAAPDFTSIDKDGKSVKLSDYKGKVVVIDFWASWCPPCRASMPHNQEVAKKFQNAGTPFVLLAVDNFEDRDAFSKWVATNGPRLSALTFVHIRSTPQYPAIWPRWPAAFTMSLASRSNM